MRSHTKHLALALLATLPMLIYGCGSPAAQSSGGEGPRGQTIEASDTNIVTSVADMSTGDMLYIDFDANNQASIDFSGADETSKYTLIVQQTESRQSIVTVSKELSTQSPKVKLDEMLRQNEAILSRNAQPEDISASSVKNFSESVEVGDREDFRVLSSLSSLSEYDTVTGEAKCIKDGSIILYIDVDIPESDLSDSDIAALCDDFDYAVELEENFFGEPSDVNGDGHVAILITLGVNRLGASGGGIVTGYFYASDLYPRSDGNPTSNYREILYILSPDSDGSDGATISKNFALSNLMTAVVPHEFQHAINYNQHVFENGGSSEETWLNEALSHFSEDLVGFGQENPSRVELFLNNPESTPLIPSGSPDLGERGAEFLFMRFLYEQAQNGTQFLRSLYSTTLTGIENVLSAFGTSDSSLDTWEELIRRWGIVLYMTNAGVTLTQQYMFDDQVENDVTGNMQGVCLICEVDDNRGTVLSGPYINELTGSSLAVTLAGTSSAFYNIETPPEELSISANEAGHQAVLIRIE